MQSLPGAMCHLLELVLGPGHQGDAGSFCCERLGYRLTNPLSTAGHDAPLACKLVA